MSRAVHADLRKIYHLTKYTAPRTNKSEEGKAVRIYIILKDICISPRNRGLIGYDLSPRVFHHVT